MAFDFDGARLHNPKLTAEHETWRNQIRRFVDEEVTPYLEAWEDSGDIDPALWKKAAEIGLMQRHYPEEYGGIQTGIDHYYTSIAIEELTRSGSAGGLMSNLLVHDIALPPVAHFGHENMKAEVIPPVLSGEKRIALGITEPSGGSDVANIKTTAIKEGDHYIVNGSKTFISGGMKADWLSCAVRTGGKGAGGVSMLLIPLTLEGVSRTSVGKKQGWRCAETATLYFDNVRVPAENLIGPEGGGFMVIMNNFNAERLALCVTMEAASRVCLEDAANWAQQRETFGKRLADHQVIRHKFAAMKQRINATQAYLNYCTDAFMENRLNPGDLALLKNQCSQTMEYCAREASQILGGASYIHGERIERIYREVRVNAIGGGSEEIMNDLAVNQYGL